MAQYDISKIQLPNGDICNIKAEQVIESGPAPIISVNNAAQYNALNLMVGIEPVQDLHGYSNPWPAGGGKNLFDNTGYRESVSGLTISLNEQGLFVISGVLAQDYAPITPTLNITDLLTDGQTYTLSITDYSTQCVYMQIIAYRADNTKVYYGATSSPRTFTVDKSTFVKYGINFQSNTMEVWGTNSRTITIGGQLESGATATSWTPYSNVCPITGWTGAQVTRTGINVWDEEWELGRLDFDKNSPTWGQNVNTEAQIRSKNYVRVQANTSYYCKSGTASTIYAIFYDANKNPVLATAGDGYTQIANVSFTAPGSAHYLRFYIMSTTTYGNDISINQPANDHEYHSYVGNTYNIAFPAAAGTVYGGTLDVTNGVLTVDRANIASYAGETLPGTWLSDRDVYAAGTNPTTGAQVVYELATPVEYTVTPHDIALLRGTNNVWADCGDTSLRYFLLGVEDIISEIDATGIPSGGTTGQVLKKKSGTDYDTEWGNATGGTWGSITGTLSNQTDLQTALNAKLNTSALLDLVYPVGSIYLSTNSANPSTIFGGTWEAYAAGRVLVGVDANDTDFSAAGNTGGEKTHTLTRSEMPSHTHNIYSYAGSVEEGTEWSVRPYRNRKEDQILGTACKAAGGDQAHNNLQPYITCYIWRRTT